MVPSSVVNWIAAPLVVIRTNGDQSLPRAGTDATASTRACVSITVAAWRPLRRKTTSEEPQGAWLQVAACASCGAVVDAEPTALITARRSEYADSRHAACRSENAHSLRRSAPAAAVSHAQR